MFWDTFHIQLYTKYIKQNNKYFNRYVIPTKQKLNNVMHAAFIKSAQSMSCERITSMITLNTPRLCAERPM